MNKNRNIWAFVAILAIVCPTLIGAKDAKESKGASMYRNLAVFNSLCKELALSYVDTIDAEKSINTAIDYMLNELDPYTEYIRAKDREDFMTISTGEYGGIGSYIMQLPTGGVVFSEPYEGSPAAEAGIRPGDKIVMIDNDSTSTWKSSKVSEHLKGQANTIVKVVVNRPYVQDSIITFNIKRRKIQMPSVPYYKAFDNGIGYILLTTFNSNSPDEVKTALLELKKNPDLKGIVLDLRGNGGGVLESAVKIVNLFVPKNTEVLCTRGRIKQDEKVYKTTQNPIDSKIPLFVLIDGGSASASEIVAGSLQDLDRAVIIGNRSFGKGLVQSTKSLPYENLLKLTVAKYYIPSGRLIQAIDYSRRNPDGSVARTPDSLTHVYHTAAGREVRDGGGITPDITVKGDTVNRLTYNIIRDNWSFNFANKFAAEHDSIAAPEDFTITDEIFNDFKAFINPDKFNYDKVCETGLKNLRKTAEVEGYMNDSTKAVFDQLEKLLHHNLSQDLDNNREAISKILAVEIQKRYYYQKGAIIESLKTDKELEEVARLLNDPVEYKKILSPKK